jgi:tetratricopeptide (TPR) repeat protein
VALQQAPARPALARAESLLAAGRLARARQVAEGLARAHPDDPAVLTVLGRIWTKWPIFGGYQAESLLTQAGELDPGNPEPFYYLALDGVRLGFADGEAIERRGLVHVLALDPTYRDAWAMWNALYRDDGDREQAVHALARHAGQSAADLWRAELLIELRRYQEAEGVLRGLATAQWDDPAPRALLARALYEQGRDAEAAPIYRAAVGGAVNDTGGVLWRQVRSIASPAERTAYRGLRPGQRAAFLRLFWEQRNPDLSDSLNRYIGEHFRRLAEARRQYALQFPQSRWYHSSLWRAVAGDTGLTPGDTGYGGDSVPGPGSGSGGGTVPGTSSVGLAHAQAGERDLPALGLAPPADTAEITEALEENLDDAGRVLVRYGKPSRHWDVWGRCGSGSCVVARQWAYDLPQGEFELTFSVGAGGNYRVRLSPSAQYLLTTDRSGVVGTLRFGFWTASFRRGRSDSTDLVLFPDSVFAVAELFDRAGEAAALDSATDRPIHLLVRPGGGEYLLALDGSRGVLRNGYRVSITVPFFPPDTLGVSSLLLASGDVMPRRDSLEAAAPPGLRLPAGRPWRAYAEVYGLQAVDGIERYAATYRFEQVGGGPGPAARERVTTFAFVRTIPAADPTIESLVIDPGRLPAGRYRLRLEVRDAASGAVVETVPRVFELR